MHSTTAHTMTWHIRTSLFTVVYALIFISSTEVENRPVNPDNGWDQQMQLAIASKNHNCSDEKYYDGRHKVERQCSHYCPPRMNSDIKINYCNANCHHYLRCLANFFIHGQRVIEAFPDESLPSSDRERCPFPIYFHDLFGFRYCAEACENDISFCSVVCPGYYSTPACMRVHVYSSDSSEASAVMSTRMSSSTVLETSNLLESPSTFAITSTTPQTTEQITGNQLIMDSDNHFTLMLAVSTSVLVVLCAILIIIVIIMKYCYSKNRQQNIPAPAAGYDDVPQVEMANLGQENRPVRQDQVAEEEENLLPSSGNGQQNIPAPAAGYDDVPQVEMANLGQENRPVRQDQVAEEEENLLPSSGNDDQDEQPTNNIMDLGLLPDSLDITEQGQSDGVAHGSDATEEPAGNDLDLDVNRQEPEAVTAPDQSGRSENRLFTASLCHLNDPSSHTSLVHEKEPIQESCACETEKKYVDSDATEKKRLMDDGEQTTSDHTDTRSCQDSETCSTDANPECDLRLSSRDS